MSSNEHQHEDKEEYGSEEEEDFEEEEEEDDEGDVDPASRLKRRGAPANDQDQGGDADWTAPAPKPSRSAPPASRANRHFYHDDRLDESTEAPSSRRAPNKSSERKVEAMGERWTHDMFGKDHNSADSVAPERRAPRRNEERNPRGQGRKTVEHADSPCVFIKGLSLESSDAEVAEYLKGLLSSGSINEVRIARSKKDGRSKGFAHVDVSDDALEQLLKIENPALNGSELIFERSTSRRIPPRDDNAPPSKPEHIREPQAERGTRGRGRGRGQGRPPRDDTRGKPGSHPPRSTSSNNRAADSSAGWGDTVMDDQPHGESSHKDANISNFKVRINQHDPENPRQVTHSHTQATSQPRGGSNHAGRGDGRMRPPMRGALGRGGPSQGPRMPGVRPTRPALQPDHSLEERVLKHLPPAPALNPSVPVSTQDPQQSSQERGQPRRFTNMAPAQPMTTYPPPPAPLSVYSHDQASMMGHYSPQMVPHGYTQMPTSSDPSYLAHMTPYYPQFQQVQPMTMEQQGYMTQGYPSREPPKYFTPVVFHDPSGMRLPAPIRGNMTIPMVPLHAPMQAPAPGTPSQGGPQYVASPQGGGSPPSRRGLPRSVAIVSPHGSTPNQ